MKEKIYVFRGDLKRDGESMGHVNVFFNLHKGTCAPERFYPVTGVAPLGYRGPKPPGVLGCEQVSHSTLCPGVAMDQKQLKRVQSKARIFTEEIH